MRNYLFGIFRSLLHLNCNFPRPNYTRYKLLFDNFLKQWNYIKNKGSIPSFSNNTLGNIFKSLNIPPEKPILAKLKGNFSKKRKFTRFIKGRLSFSKKGNVEFKILKGQESYKIKPFAKSNSWGVFKDGKAKFKIGEYIACYSSSGINEFLIN